MSEKQTNKLSLINPEEKQLYLIESDQLPASIFEESEKLTDDDGDGYKREFTAARLFARKPEVYNSIISLSAEGLGALRIGRLLKVSPNTVLAVRAREGEIVDIEKERISRECRAAARMCVEGIVEDLTDPARRRKISAKDKAIIHGVLIEKAELIAGLPTSRIDHSGSREPSADDYNNYLNGMKTIEAECSEIPGAPDEAAGMIPAPEEVKQKAATAAGPAAPGSRAALDTGSGASGTDTEGKGASAASDNETAHETTTSSQQKASEGSSASGPQSGSDLSAIIEDDQSNKGNAPGIDGARARGGGGGHGMPPSNIL